MPQGPEEMCLLLEHQNPSKTSEIMVILIALTIALQFRYTYCMPGLPLGDVACASEAFQNGEQGRSGSKKSFTVDS